MKSQVNNQPPQSFTFLWTKPKQRQMLIELETDIDNKNKYLVRRMLSARSECSSRKRGLKLKDSLIKDHSRRVSCEIDSENKVLKYQLRNC